MGKFIAIDGLDGSGKHTQSELLCRYLSDQGMNVRKLEFPRYDEDSSLFVKMYLSGELGEHPSDTSAYAASMFFAADRYISYRRDWHRDHDDPDTVIVSDRYTTANAIHQLSKLPVAEWDSFLPWLWDFEFHKLGLPEPNLVIFLEVPPEVSLSLVSKRSEETGRRQDIHELDPEYMLHSHSAGLYASEKLGWSKVSCSDGGRMRPRDDIFNDVKALADGILRK